MSLLKSECILLNVGHHEENTLLSHPKSHSCNHENDLTNEEGKIFIFCSDFLNCSREISCVKNENSSCDLFLFFMSEPDSFFCCSLVSMFSIYTNKQWHTVERFSHFSEKLVGNRNYRCSVLEIFARIGFLL